MPNYENYNEVVKLQGMAQDSSQFLREKIREQRNFLHLPDGMWDDDARTRTEGQPRYTIDKTTPLIEDTTGRIKKSDFGIKVQPVDSSASEEAAEIISGLIRNISNISGADHIYNQAVSSVVEAGLDGWEIVQAFADPNSFHQDILVEPIHNFVDRVWFDHASLSRTPIDARHAFKLSAFSLDAYKEKWPKGSMMTLSQDQHRVVVENANDNVIVGQVYYMKETETELVLMSDDKVYVVDEKFNKIKDELKKEGITVVQSRTAKTQRQWIRQYDGGGWLKDAEETVFEHISLVPEYGKFKVIDNTITARGITLKQMDLNRIYNYAKSRQTAEVALSPRDKLMVTREQVSGNTGKWATMNVDADPALVYNHVEGQPPPFKIQGAQVNMGLEALAMSMTEDMRQVANKFSASMGDGINAASGVLVDELKESSQTGDIDWTEGHEIALCYGYKVMLSGIKRVYDGARTVRILGDDGTFAMEELNTTRRDEQTGEIITLNDMSAGLYEVVCSAGKSYKTRQGETLANILEIATIDPSIISGNQDILASTADGPGMKDVSERWRAQNFKAGAIPQSQWTDEEIQEVQAQQQAAQNQPPQEDPLMVAARAEEGKAQAELQNAGNKQAEIQMDAQNKQGALQLEAQKLQLENKKVDLDTEKFLRSGQEKFNVEAAKIDQGQQKIDLQSDKQQFEQMKAIIDGQQSQINDAVKNIQLLGDMDQFDYDPDTQELIKRG